VAELLIGEALTFRSGERKARGAGDIMSTSTSIKEVMRELAGLEDPKMREANERRGDDHGVNLTHLRALAIEMRPALSSISTVAILRSNRFAFCAMNLQVLGSGANDGFGPMGPRMVAKR
jgi:hypothetical protein